MVSLERKLIEHDDLSNAIKHALLRFDSDGSDALIEVRILEENLLECEQEIATLIQNASNRGLA